MRSTAADRTATRGAALAASLLVATTLAGCGSFSWRSLWPWSRPAPVAAAPAPGVDRDVRDADAARAACANYGEVFARVDYPRDAIIRGLDRGHASIRFRVDGDRVAITTVTSSDPSFGDAAAETIRKLRCHADRTTTFEVPFDWRSVR